MVTSSVAIGALQSLHGLAGAVGTADSIEIFDASLRCLAQGLRVERSGILLFDQQPVMRFRAGAGLSDETDVLPFPTPLHDAEGNLTGPVNVMIDIHRAQAEMARQGLLDAVRDSEPASSSRSPYTEQQPIQPDSP